MTPVVYDVFCGAGGAALGYHRCGFRVVGVDLAPQPRYPFDFIQMDALAFLRLVLEGWVIRPAAIHASPPCQAHSDLQKQSKIDYVDYIPPTRDLLEQIGLPYVIENVEGAPLRDPAWICGASIPGLRVIRHRQFETNWPLTGIDCPRDADGRVAHPLVFTYDRRKGHYGKLDQDVSYVQVTGGGNAKIANKLDAMGIDWMTNDEVNEAIPPAYTEHVGRQLMSHLARAE